MWGLRIGSRRKVCSAVQAAGRRSQVRVGRSILDAVRGWLGIEIGNGDGENGI